MKLQNQINDNNAVVKKQLDGTVPTVSLFESDVGVDQASPWKSSRRSSHKNKSPANEAGDQVFQKGARLDVVSGPIDNKFRQGMQGVAM